MGIKAIRLFRMTHIENVQHILKHGITHKNSKNSNPDYRPIGDSSLINARNFFKVPGGKNLGDYIPFYFGLRTPMLYVIQNGFNGVRAISPEEIVYIVTNVELVCASKINFLYTDGHATDRFSRYYTSNEVDNIIDQVDFQATNAVYWKKDDDLDFKRRKEAEFLLEEDLPLQYIIGIIVYNSKAQNFLIGNGVNVPIRIEPDYYF